MTEILAYAELTWPQVAALPRDMPLVIPLGKRLPLHRLSECFGNPERIGLLPEIPYGWRGSGLAVPEAVLQRLLLNLLDSLQEDGFTNVRCLTPQDMGMDLGSRKIVLPHPSQHRPAQFIPAAEDIQKVVIIPVGHTEQHGYHLPLIHRYRHHWSNCRRRCNADAIFSVQSACLALRSKHPPPGFCRDFERWRASLRGFLGRCPG